MPAVGLVARAVKHNVLVDAALYWGISWLFSKILTLGADAKKKESAPSQQPGEAQGEDDDDTQPMGWSGLRMGGVFPSVKTQLWQVAVGYVGYDMMFYWSHRLLHHKSIYRLCHKQHHEFHTPIAPSCSHEHWAESLTQMFNWYLPIGNSTATHMLIRAIRLDIHLVHP